jgi:hypothetical protein
MATSSRPKGAGARSGWWRPVIIWRKDYQETHAGAPQDPPVKFPRP